MLLEKWEWVKNKMQPKIYKKILKVGSATVIIYYIIEVEVESLKEFIPSERDEIKNEVLWKATKIKKR